MSERNSSAVDSRAIGASRGGFWRWMSKVRGHANAVSPAGDEALSVVPALTLEAAEVVAPTFPLACTEPAGLDALSPQVFGFLQDVVSEYQHGVRLDCSDLIEAHARSAAFADHGNRTDWPAFSNLLQGGIVAPHSLQFNGDLVRASEALKSGALEEARTLIASVLANDPSNPVAFQLLGILALHEGDVAEGTAAFEQGLRCQPDVATESALWFNLAQSHEMSGHVRAALLAYGQLLVCDPKNVTALLERARLWAAEGEHALSAQDASAVLKQLPANESAMMLHAVALLQLGDYPGALQAFLQIESVRPGSPFVACMALFLTRRLCRWQSVGFTLRPAEVQPVMSLALKVSTALFESPDGESPALVLERQQRQSMVLDLALLVHRDRQGEAALEPFESLVLFDDPGLRTSVAKRWLKNLHPEVPVDADAQKGFKSTGRLCVAYVSCDFYDHAMAYSVIGLLEAHDRTQVQVVVVSYGPPRDDAMRERFVQTADVFVDATHLTDTQVAARCRELGVDVAVDLKGVTPGARPGIFAHRAAPVQVNWLGFPGTLPAPYFDVILADELIIPESQLSSYNEQVVHLPRSYVAYTGAAAGHVPKRSDHGLPEDALVLCCFAESFSFHPDVWAVWMRLLQAQPKAVLWLSACHPDAVSQLRAHAQTHQVDADRLIFASEVPHSEHLTRLALADLSLETMPFNSHIPVCEALWAGVPHVSCLGRSFSARLGASLLQSVGLPQLVRQDLSSYEALLLALVSRPERMSDVRKTLAQNKLAAPLFDAVGFARDMEQVLIQLPRHATAAVQCPTH